MGVTFAFFHFSEMSPHLHNFSKIMESGLTMTSASSLNILRQILSGPTDL